MGVIAFARSSARLHARLHDKLRSSAAAGMTWKVSATRRGKEKQGSEHDMLLAAYLRGELSGASGQARGSATRKLRGQRGETAASRHHRLWGHCIQTCSTKGFLPYPLDLKEV